METGYRRARTNQLSDLGSCDGDSNGTWTGGKERIRGLSQTLERQTSHFNWLGVREARSNIRRTQDLSREVHHSWEQSGKELTEKMT